VIVLATALSALSLGLGFVQPPYLGVACPGANVTTCGRVGIAVWLAGRPAEVDATLERHSVRLQLKAAPIGMWVGFVHLPLRSLGIPPTWYGSEPVKRLTLHLRVRFRSGWRTGQVRVQLAPGWG
jgi:hypothetical protein